jgi:hypothetical protein
MRPKQTWLIWKLWNKSNNNWTSDLFRRFIGDGYRYPIIGGICPQEILFVYSIPPKVLLNIVFVSFV